MQTFVRVAEAGSFSAVADQLQVARSVVTRQIAALERHLGTKLITRTTRRLSLTAAGTAYLERCRLILNLVEAAESSLDEDRGAPRGRIRIGLPLSFGLRELMHPLLDFAHRYPEVELVMDLSDERANLVEEGLDLSIRITSDVQPAEVVRPLGQCRMLTLASPAYLDDHGEPRHPSDLAHHPCLIYASEAESNRWPYQVGGQTLRVPVRGAIVANNGVVLTEAAARGMGIARQPDFIAADYLARGLLIPVLERFEQAPLGIHAVLPGNRYIPHRVRVLIDEIAEVLRSRLAPAPRRPGAKRSQS